MANPQVEKGHTKIANEILEQLMRIYLSPNQWQVLMCIIRKTYGYQKKVDFITNSQIVEATGMHKSHVSRALHSLEVINLITRNSKNIGFQKDWEKWQKLSKLVPNKLPELVTKKLPELVTNEKLPELVTLNEKLPELVTKNGELPELVTLNEKLPELVTNEKLPDMQLKLPDTTTKVTSALVTQKKKETIKKKYIYSLFLKFWETYPKKEAKEKAQQVFIKLNPSEELLAVIIKAIKLQQQTPQWLEDGGKFIPLPASWLNGKRWEDEIPTAKILASPEDKRYSVEDYLDKEAPKVKPNGHTPVVPEVKTEKEEAHG
jgi:phage replication O-like protein O